MNDSKKELIRLKLEAPDLLKTFEQYEEYSTKLKELKNTTKELIKLIRSVEQQEWVQSKDEYMSAGIKDEIIWSFTTGTQINKTFNFRLREIRDLEQKINKLVEESERMKKETVIIRRYECTSCGEYSGEMKNNKCINCNDEESKEKIKFTIAKRFGDD